jgi:hypothetical protein
MRNYYWTRQFKTTYEQAVTSYRAGQRDPQTIFSPEDKSFLASIGCTARELFDFVEDFCRANEPDLETVLLITAVRRDFFLTEQNGIPSTKVISTNELPSKDAELGGLKWLPRIIQKAEAKLRGETPPDLMYGCGGDRPFLKSIDVHPADFLRLVWRTNGDEQKILGFIREHSPTRRPTLEFTMDRR